MAATDHAFETSRLRIALRAPEHAAGLLAYAVRNREHLRPWEGTPSQDQTTLAYWQNAVTVARREAENDVGYRFVAREQAGDDIVALVNLSAVIRGKLQGCFLGYSVDKAYEGRGFASEAVRAVVDYGFERLNLHRIGANYRPTNERSGALLRRLGFVVEGYARDYLFNDGVWHDHILTAKTALSVPPTGARPE
jgi:ribosomal-protein-alanine N-acetyltransferase